MYPAMGKGLYDRSRFNAAITVRGYCHKKLCLSRLGRGGIFAHRSAFARVYGNFAKPEPALVLRPLLAVIFAKQYEEDLSFHNM